MKYLIVLFLLLSGCASGSSSAPPTAVPLTEQEKIIILVSPVIGLMWKNAADVIGNDYKVCYSVKEDRYALLYKRYNKDVLLVLKHTGIVQNAYIGLGDYVDIYK